jgi:predicted aspartyl protease
VLLGVLALEALELKVKPTTGRLERAELLLM